jgi:hypothetical protein
VESGTFNGETIFAMKPYFTILYTVEIVEYYFNKVMEAASVEDIKKITIIWADTELYFPRFLPTLDEPAIFFLDSHYSGAMTGFGSKTVPLLEEISHIAMYFKHPGIIIIDDYRLFKTEHWEYITKREVLSRIADRITKVYFLPSVLAYNDRLVIHIEGLVMGA